MWNYRSTWRFITWLYLAGMPDPFNHWFGSRPLWGLQQITHHSISHNMHLIRINIWYILLLQGFPMMPALAFGLLWRAWPYIRSFLQCMICDIRSSLHWCLQNFFLCMSFTIFHLPAVEIWEPRPHGGFMPGLLVWAFSLVPYLLLD